jgi:tetratricopeptide (TPR) repeat protein
MLGLSASQIKGFVDDGLVSPKRDRAGELRFSFQDLVLLRTAKGLIDADIPTRRVRSALDSIRRRLPRGRPLTGVHIFADGKEVLVQEGDEVWNPESGQTLINFGVSSLVAKAEPFARRAAAAARDEAEQLGAEDWYELACELELTAPDEAIDAYRRALEIDPRHADAHLNLGRLLHEEADLEAAEHHYRAALGSADDATARFNLGVVLEDQERFEEALATYMELLERDDSYADAHYNLAGLYERLGRKDAALRHLKAYKALRDRGQAPQGG